MIENPTSVPCPLRYHALRSPDAGAISGAGWSVSYGELDGRVSAAERRLAEAGIGRGSRAALYMPKSVDYVVLLLAMIRAGIVACPVSTRLPAGGVEPLLAASGCSALISADEDFAETVGGVELLHSDALLADNGMDEEAHGPLEMPLDRPATVVFTSGSSGAPKAALHTFGNHYFNALGSNQNIALAPGDRWLHSLPLYHVGGLSILFRCLISGATMVLPEAEATLGESIVGSGATHVSLVSTQLQRLLRGDDDLGELEAVLMGGGPMPEGLVDEAVGRGLPIHTSYGLTEMASQVTTTSPGASVGELRTSGRVLPYREVRVSGEGEILVRGRTLFAGYVGDRRPDRPFDEDNWFHTGDLGELDADGYLTVTGRRDNLFVSGGENVQPEEIEAALGRIEGVEEAVVVPVPDAEFGSRPVAFLRTSGEVADLARELAKVLPRYKIPKTFHEWEGTDGMKPDRVTLERRARQMRGA